ncbi:MAG TPA: hypothetical protein VK524_07660 [Polyangiaceae bacterium]|nr:hypothetical protein [Polyangiaceae bacterium]
MLLSVDANIPFEKSLVFRTYRDDLLELVEFMPTIRRVEIRSREEHGPIVKMVNVWYGGSEIPAAARVVMTDSLLSWTEHAEWNQSDLTCAWRIETHSFREAVECRGSNRFIEDGTGTHLEIRGDLVIDASQIRGVPKLLGKSLGKTVSDLLLKKITPNLIEATDGLRRYLERKQKV